LPTNQQLHKTLIPTIKEPSQAPNNPKVQKEISKNNIDPTNEAALLRLFGVHSISNPFLLMAH
jgi:hypothetical protein